MKRRKDKGYFPGGTRESTPQLFCFQRTYARCQLQPNRKCISWEERDEVFCRPRSHRCLSVFDGGKSPGLHTFGFCVKYAFFALVLAFLTAFAIRLIVQNSSRRFLLLLLVVL